MIVFGGSSVTAGHDNKYEQSYPEIASKRLKPIFQALNISLVVYNIAQGNNACLPSDLCYGSMGVNDPDIATWEQSFYCGKDPGIYS